MKQWASVCPIDQQQQLWVCVPADSGCSAAVAPQQQMWVLSCWQLRDEADFRLVVIVQIRLTWCKNWLSLCTGCIAVFTAVLEAEGGYICNGLMYPLFRRSNCRHVTVSIHHHRQLHCSHVPLIHSCSQWCLWLYQILALYSLQLPIVGRIVPCIWLNSRPYWNE